MLERPCAARRNGCAWLEAPSKNNLIFKNCHFRETQFFEDDNFSLKCALLKFRFFFGRFFLRILDFPNFLLHIQEKNLSHQSSGKMRRLQKHRRKLR